MTTDLREGLAKLLSDYSPCGCLDCQDSCHEQADEILTYLRAHDGHAEFVRRVLAIASLSVGPKECDYRLNDIRYLCTVELAKEQSK